MADVLSQGAAETIREENEMLHDKVEEPTSDGYYEQVAESDGFDVDNFFKNSDKAGMIVPCENFKCDPELFAAVNDCATKAINQFNKENREHYNFVEVLKVNWVVVAGFIYFITFQATSKRGGLKTFQARVWDGVSHVEVQLCRLKRLR